MLLVCGMARRFAILVVGFGFRYCARGCLSDFWLGVGSCVVADVFYSIVLGVWWVCCLGFPV